MIDSPQTFQIAGPCEFFTALFFGMAVLSMLGSLSSYIQQILEEDKFEELAKLLRSAGLKAPDYEPKFQGIRRIKHLLFGAGGVFAAIAGFLNALC